MHGGNTLNVKYDKYTNNFEKLLFYFRSFIMHEGGEPVSRCNQNGAYKHTIINEEYQVICFSLSLTDQADQLTSHDTL